MKVQISAKLTNGDTLTTKELSNPEDAIERVDEVEADEVNVVVHLTKPSDVDQAVRVLMALRDCLPDPVRTQKK